MTYQPRLLLVENDNKLLGLLTQVLKSAYRITPASSGNQALTLALRGYFNVILLESDLPDISGQEICQKLRDRGVKTPILILSGNTLPSNKVLLLDSGANDYLTKPCNSGELQARLRALCRNFNTVQLKNNERLKFSEITLNRQNYSVKRNGHDIKLRTKEFEILALLMREARNIVTKDDLINNIWQGNYYLWGNALEVHVKHLRDKVDKPFSTPLIHTVHGKGYKLDYLKR